MKNEVPDGFRLLEVKGDRTLSFNPIRTAEASAITILLGENGVGKSRLLGDIVRSFSLVRNYYTRKKSISSTKDIPSLKLPNSICYEIRGKTRKLDENSVKLNMPRALVAVSMSAFHKFPSNLGYSRHPELQAAAEADFYNLIGTSHNNLGRSALTTALYSLVDNFAKPNHDSARLAHVLNFLKYERKLTIEFGRRISKKDLDTLIEDPKNFFEKVISRRSRGTTFSEQRLARFLEVAKKEEIAKFSSMVKKFNNFFPSGRISVHLDLDKSNKESLNKLKIISKLAQFGIATPRDLLMYKANDDAVSLAQASSGELVITTIILGIANSIQENSLILIDEPEISLHPAWQQNFLRLLLEAFSEYKSCHFIIATHSPLIVAEASEFNANVISMNLVSNAEVVSERSASGSIEEIMLETFKVPTPNNRYLLERLTDLTKLAATHQISPEEFEAAIGKYALQVSRMKDDDPQKKIFALMENYGEAYGNNK